MRPGCFMKNTGNSISGNSVFFGEFPLGFDDRVLFSYFKDIAFTKFCCGRISSFSLILSSFFYHVGHVVFVCSKKKMIRSNAKSIVTFMTNKKVFLNFSIMNYPRKSMSKIMAIFSNAKLAISRIKLSSGPFPTFMKWDEFNFIPKSFHKMTLLFFEIKSKREGVQ